MVDHENRRPGGDVLLAVNPDIGLGEPGEQFYRQTGGKIGGPVHENSGQLLEKSAISL
jgi:hypothetical protein